MELTRDNLLDMYRRMVRIRFFEEGISKFDEQGEVAGTGHVSIGEEAIAVGATTAMGARDYLVSTHRGHGHLLARGASMPIILAEVLGKVTGCTGGKGGSMHLSDFSRYILGTNGIVGGGISIAGGLGLAIKMQKTDQVCLCFFGDGASNRGVFHEALNMASLWKVPTVFLCTNNQYAMTLPLCRGCANQDISARAVAYDIPGYRVDGTDVIAVYEAVSAALEQARKGAGPSLIEVISYRLRGHSMRMDRMPGGSSYRPEGELDDWWENKDPIKIFKKKLIELDYLTEEAAARIDTECHKEFDEAAEFAHNSPEPSPESIFEGIYSKEGVN
ncbi:MAG: thiamine pyrophosphate-dependent dehydrogenase E1 component subunit alpha [Dehalococcoidales bacterium]